MADSALSVFADDVRAHAAGRPCLGVSVDPGFPVPAPTGFGVGWR
jgi:hypothetical protein